jgi:hypothetical protein
MDFARPIEKADCDDYVAARMVRKAFRNRLIAGLWMATMVVSTVGWLVALAWIAYLAIRRFFL